MLVSNNNTYGGRWSHLPCTKVNTIHLISWLRQIRHSHACRNSGTTPRTTSSAGLLLSIGFCLNSFNNFARLFNMLWSLNQYSYVKIEPAMICQILKKTDKNKFKDIDFELNQLSKVSTFSFVLLDTKIIKTDKNRVKHIYKLLKSWTDTETSYFTLINDPLRKTWNYLFQTRCTLIRVWEL